MKVKHEYIQCDVCERPVYSEGKTKEITFSYEGKSFTFDACFVCLTGSSNIRGVYKKITDLIKGVAR